MTTQKLEIRAFQEVGIVVRLVKLSLGTPKPCIGVLAVLPGNTPGRQKSLG